MISASYGVSEFDAPVNYTRRQYNEFLKLGLQGHTIMYASGDYGIASFPGDDSANGCLGPNSTVYSPSFPTCPGVLNVGATRLYADQTVDDPKSAMQANLGPGAELFASAGGFVIYFPVPAYQQLAVSEYFAFHEPGLPYYYANDQATNISANGGFYNRAGRGFCWNRHTSRHRIISALSHNILNHRVLFLYRQPGLPNIVSHFMVAYYNHHVLKQSITSHSLIELTVTLFNILPSCLLSQQLPRRFC